MIGPGAFSHGTPEKKAEVALAMRQWVPNQNGGQPVLLMNNAEGKLIGVELPKDLKTLEKAMENGSFKGWTPVGALSNDRLEKFKANQESIPIQEWSAGSWKPKAAAVATGGGAPTGPKEPAPKTGQTAGGGTGATDSTNGGTDTKTAGPKASSEVPSMVASGKCNSCHRTEMRGDKLFVKGHEANLNKFNAKSQIMDLSESEISAIRKFLGG
jgi:hypothetical protein